MVVKQNPEEVWSAGWRVVQSRRAAGGGHPSLTKRIRTSYHRTRSGRTVYLDRSRQPILTDKVSSESNVGGAICICPVLRCRGGAHTFT